jgi:hypothetical protein
MASGPFSEAHLAQRLVSGVAHWLQNREPATLSVPHFEQRIGHQQRQNDRLASCTTPVAQRALRSGSQPIQVTLEGPVFHLYGEIERQMPRGLLDPLEIVDLHDPLAPLDRESSIQ